MAQILVVGGAGYVGSSVTAFLLDQGHQVAVLDDLSTGFKSLVLGDSFIQARAGDREALESVFNSKSFDCVMHFAARSLVEESVRMPDAYFENNVEQTRRLLEVMIKHHVRHFVFSSTAAIFGMPDEEFIHEEVEKKPINPYGESKVAAEELIQSFAESEGIRAIALRYFNAAGAEPQNRVGECRQPATHLIPTAIRAGLDGKPIKVFGNDYPTPDGTCVRDYIHVEDLARAHSLVMDRLLDLPDSEQGYFDSFNLGSGNGYSVREVIDTVEEALEKKIQSIDEPRREGDPPRLVADSEKISRETRFKREHDLESIVKSAIAWEKKRRSLQIGK